MIDLNQGRETIAPYCDKKSRNNAGFLGSPGDLTADFFSVVKGIANWEGPRAVSYAEGSLRVAFVIGICASALRFIFPTAVNQPGSVITRFSAVQNGVTHSAELWGGASFRHEGFEAGA